MCDPSTPTSLAATQAVDSSSADDELGSHYNRDITLVAPQMQPPSTHSNQPNGLGARPVTDRAQCEFKMYRLNPPNGDPIEVRTEKLFELDVSLRTGPDKASAPNTGAVDCSRPAALDSALDGATTGTLITSACPKCSKKGPSGPPNYSLFDFVAQNNLVEITGGNPPISFRLQCLPRHHGTTDREYRLSATISDDEQTLGQYQYPNWLRIVHHLNRGKNRPPVALQQASKTSGVVELGESGQSHDARPNAHFSGGSTSGTSAGGALPVQPSWTSAQSPVSNAFTQIYRANEEFEPGWQRSGLRAPASAARRNNRIHEKSPVLSHINPNRGPTKGGDEIYLIVRYLPSTTDLYARFGGEIVPTSRLAPGVLSCRLPAAVHPGVVEVTLCQTPSLHDEGYGKSLVSFEYDEDSSEAFTACWNTFNGGNIIDPRIKIGSAISPGTLTTSHSYIYNVDPMSVSPRNGTNKLDASTPI